MHNHQGAAVSPGIGIGPCFQFRHVNLEFKRLEVADTASEQARLETALTAAETRLQASYEQVARDLGQDEAAIFRAHLTILRDPELLDGIRQQMDSQKVNAEAAVYDVSESFSRQLEAIDDEYIQARAADIRDVRDGILKSLLGIEQSAWQALTTPSIIISRSLTPSDCIAMDSRKILGFCTIEGGTTSHAAILARSLGVPAVAGVDEGALNIAVGTAVVLDGDNGQLLYDLDRPTLETYEKRQAARQKARDEARKEALLPAVTLDGHKVHVLANLGTAERHAVEDCVRNGAEGVGLLRTEFVYLECRSMPDEETQYQKYRTVVDVFGERPVILRTIDIGGDKELPYLELPHELNPFLGVRGLRLSLRHPDLFKTQLRAALRAAHGRNLLIMFPMVTKASEIRQAHALLQDARRELAAASRPFADNVEIGIMVEVPTAALLADRLADEVDFFSIGTNDLSQYTMAIDRTNTELNKEVDALDPSVLRLVAGVIQAAHRKGKKVGVCGELAGEPLAIPILLGLELDDFSMNAPAIPGAKGIIRQLRMREARDLAQAVLTLESAAEVRRCVRERLPNLKAAFET